MDITQPGEYELFDVLTAILRGQQLGYASGVTGGGVNELIGYLMQGGVNATVASSETDGIGRMFGHQRLLKPGFAASFSTHGVGIAQQASTLEYLSHRGRIPAIAIIGANKDGSVGPSGFQYIDEEKYRSLFGPNIFKITRAGGVKPETLVEELIDMLDGAYAEGGPVLLSVPNNLGRLKFAVSADDIEGINMGLFTTAMPLSSEARDKLDELVTRINGEGQRVLFMPGEGIGHTIRLGGMEVFDLLQRTMEKMVGNRIVSADWADLLMGHTHELTIGSHNYDPKIDAAVGKCNTVVCFGTGPDATITGIGKEAVYKQKHVVIIDPRQDILDEWKGDLPNAITICADLRLALQYLHEKGYEHVQTRQQEAEKLAGELRKLVMEGEQELPRAQKMRALHTAIARVLSGFDGTGMVVDSGDGANQYLRYRTKFDGPGKLFYPGQGMLGLVAGAAHAYTDSGIFGRTVMLTGDGGMGYSVGELSHLAAQAHRLEKPTVVVVMNNGAHGAVGKGIGIGDKRDDIKPKMERQNVLPAVDFSKVGAMLPDHDVRGANVEGTEPHNVAAQLQAAFAHNGLTVLNVNTREIGYEPAPATPSR